MSAIDKPLNIFAVLFWLAGIVFLIGDPVWMLVWMHEQHLGQLAGSTARDRSALQAMSTEQAWLVARNAVIGAGGLIAYGVIIELLDGLRWRATPDEERPTMRWRYVLRRLDGLRPSMASLRAWPDRPKAPKA